MRINRRLGFITGATLVAGLLAAALYLQHAVGLAPCPLCILQRLAFFAVGAFCLLGALFPGRLIGRLAAGGICLSALSGALLAARHVWLQNLPADQIPECGPGLDFILNTFPLSKALDLILSGSGECAEIQWQFLGLTLPGWSLVWLLVFAAAGAVAARRRRNGEW